MDKMEDFRKRNKFLIYLVNFTGLHTRSIRTFTTNKFVLLCLRLWNKVSLILLPLYLGSAFKFVLFHEAHFEIKLGVIRRSFAFGSYYIKNMFFFFKRDKIEEVIDLWDSSFEEEFYDAEKKKLFDRVHKTIDKVVKFSFLISILPSLIYTIPPFFSKSKILPHPTGFPYKEQSPDYEAMVAFDFFRVVLGCCSEVGMMVNKYQHQKENRLDVSVDQQEGSAFDCLLISLLSLELAQLMHLQECLTTMLHEIVIDDDGALAFKMESAPVSGGVRDSNEGKKKSTVSKFISKIRKKNAVKEEEGVTPVYTRYGSSASETADFQRKTRVFEERMRVWVSHHQQALRYFERLSSLYNPIVSMQLVYVVMYTCFTAFHLIAAKPSLSDIFVLPFVAGSNVVSLFWWCRLGDRIAETNSELFRGGFAESWHLFPSRIQRNFYFVTMRGRRRLGLTGLMLYPFNSVTFFEIFKITYQLFAFVMHVYDKA